MIKHPYSGDIHFIKFNNKDFWIDDGFMLNVNNDFLNVEYYNLNKRTSKVFRREKYKEEKISAAQILRLENFDD